ncbi:MAG: hypothetical protein OEZ43_18955 [Gammaproteobacteria bacterium]|nr:hypothetical protein [Gammaproteobacteria bacterium]
MDIDLEPVVDNWYLHLDKGQNFRVIAVDDVIGVIEIQHFDGDIEEITFDDWAELEIELSEEPTNWAGALDIAEPDDYGTEITDTADDDWLDPIQEVKKPTKAHPATW